MSNLQQSIAGKLESVEARFDRLKRRLGQSLGGGPQSPILVPYRSYGRADRMVVRGRVLEDKQISAGLAEDSIWQNLLNTYRRLESDEIVGARIEASNGEARAEAISDEEGYFELWLEGASGPDNDGWRDVQLKLSSPLPDGAAPVEVGAPVLIPSRSASFGVISDIDDTVMLSHATELIRMARLTFLGNSQTRMPFPGVAAYYRALNEGIGACNPLFYLSSSPWNLYDLIEDFFRLQRIPAGPMFLRDWGISREEFLPTSHSGHKLKAIEEIFEFYKDLPFILIGDSGQQDPEIYAEAVRRYTRRVLAVYIRDVSSDALRDSAVQELAEEVTHAGSTLILAEDTLAMARHAAENGWIDAERLGEIADEIDVDRHDTDEPVV